MLTQQEVKRLWDYDPSTGIFRWKAGTGMSVKVGAIAGSKREDGYWRLKLRSRRYYAHRLAFLWVHGRIPKNIDHIDGDPSNNAITNLRECEHHENIRNQYLHRNNTTGFKGVCFNKRRGRYEAYIAPNRCKRHLGYFETPQAAHAAYVKAAEKHFGAFARAIT